MDSIAWFCLRRFKSATKTPLPGLEASTAAVTLSALKVGCKYTPHNEAVLFSTVANNLDYPGTPGLALLGLDVPLAQAKEVGAELWEALRVERDRLRRVALHATEDSEAATRAAVALTAQLGDIGLDIEDQTDATTAMLRELRDGLRRRSEEVVYDAAAEADRARGDLELFDASLSRVTASLRATNGDGDELRGVAVAAHLTHGVLRAWWRVSDAVYRVAMGGIPNR